MFSKPYFNSEDKDALSALQFQYVKALLERSKNPSDYDANIECLRKFEKMHLERKKIIQPYLEDEKKHNKSKSTAMEKSNKIIFPSITKEFLQDNVVKDSRITKVVVEDQKEGSGLNYMICFSDGSELKLESLTDKNALDKAKDFFTKKMEELQKPQLTRSGLR